MRETGQAMATKSQNQSQEDRYITIWSKAVDTQMHFNEMSAKSRQLGLTFVVAVLGVALILVSRGDDFAFEISVGGTTFQIHVSVILILGAWSAIVAVQTLDLEVYHKMLRGAVTFGEDFEEKYMKQIFSLEKGMTQAVSHFARYEDAQRTAPTVQKSAQYSGCNEVTTEDKIKKFYKRIRWFTLIAAAVLFVATNWVNWERMNPNSNKVSLQKSEMALHKGLARNSVK